MQRSADEQSAKLLRCSTTLHSLQRQQRVQNDVAPAAQSTDGPTRQSTTYFVLHKLGVPDLTNF